MKLKVKKHLPAILTGLGVVGSAAVGVSAGIAQHKVEEELYTLRYYKLEDGIEPTKKDYAKTYANNYLPTAIIFALTSGCIIGSNRLSQKQYKQLLGAYASLGAGFAGYRRAVIEKYGEEADDELCESASYAIMSQHDHIDPLLCRVPGKELLFYEPYTKTYFHAQERDIILAEYHLNRHFCLSGGIAYVDDLLYYLGIEPTAQTDNIGWTAEHGYYWVDIRHTYIGKHNGEDCYQIEYIFDADKDPEEYIAQPWEDEYQEDSYVGNV